MPRDTQASVSGLQANQAVYFSMLKPGGDVILRMSLARGHLTHGASVNISGKLFHSVAYSLAPETEEIDYDGVLRLALEHKPKLTKEVKRLCDRFPVYAT